MNLIIRSHQLTREGFLYSFIQKNLVTIWTVPNHLNRVGNPAAIMEITQHLERKFHLFDTEECRLVENNYILEK